MRDKALSAVAILIAILLVLLALGASDGGFTALGRGSTDTFAGTSAPGSHEFYDADPDAGFCDNCHSGVHDELFASIGAHSDDPCLNCHAPQTGAHAASPAQCSDCHGGTP